MRSRIKLASGVLLSLVTIAPVAIPARILSYSTVGVVSQAQSGDRQIPIANYVVPESTDVAERAKRQEKSRRYGGKKIKEQAQITEVTESESSAERLPSLPVGECDALIIGEVRNAQAFLSDDKTGIYSEFTILVEEVLKSNGESALNPGATIIAEREGGGVRFPSGHVQLYTVSGERMPKVWTRYLLFLKRNDPGQDFRLLKGYQLSMGQVFPMDDFSRDAAIKGMNQDAFLATVRGAIARPPKTRAEKGR